MRTRIRASLFFASDFLVSEEELSFFSAVSPPVGFLPFEPWSVA